MARTHLNTDTYLSSKTASEIDPDPRKLRNARISGNLGAAGRRTQVPIEPPLPNPQ